MNKSSHQIPFRIKNVVAALSLLLCIYCIPAFGDDIQVRGQMPPYSNYPITFLYEREYVPTHALTYNLGKTDSQGNFYMKFNDCIPGGGQTRYTYRLIMADGTLTTSIPEFDGYANWCAGFAVDLDPFIFPSPRGPLMDASRYNAGPYACASVGRPVNVTNGNMWLEQTDYLLPETKRGLKVTRTYNSTVQVSGLFGYGWSSDYDIRLLTMNQGLIQLDIGNGQVINFTNIGNSIYVAASPNVYGQIVLDGTEYVLTWKDGSTSRFSATGSLLWEKDQNGNQTTFNYDTNNQLIGIADPFGRTLTLTPGANGKISQISDSIGVVATYEYDSTNVLLKTVTYADGSKYKFDYTTAGTNTYLATVKDALDNILETHQYDTQGRAITSEKQGGVEKYTLDYMHASDATPYTSVTDALNRVTKYYFDLSHGKNAITKVEGLCGCGGSSSEITQYFYDANLNLTKQADALNHETTYTYDANGNRLTETDGLGTQKFTYNSLGEILTYRDRIDSQNPDPNVNTVVNTYDTAGNLLTSKDALNNTTTLTYTSLGQLATTKDALNHATTLTYDNQGRLTQVKDANNKTTNLAYDARVRPTSVTNALSETTSFEYDLNNRLKKVVYPDANFITYSYDLAGRRTGITDARNNNKTYAYDGAYRLTNVTDALAHSMSFGYDLMSNLTSRTDALGNVTNYDYDDFNRLKTITYPAATVGATRLTENLTYDAVGNVQTRVDTAGRNTFYEYDTSNRLTTLTDAENDITQFEYDARSQLTKVTDDANQQYLFTYDPLGHELSQTRAGTTMTFLYDAVGNRTKRSDYLGRVTNYQYNNLNRLTNVVYGTSPSGGQQSTYTYDDLSRLVSAVNDTGTVSFTYDNRGREKTETDVFGHVVEYGYDANGNRNLLKMDGANYASYAYDNADRLTAITNLADGTNVTYGYDIADRMTSRSYPNSVNTSYSYDGMSRLTELKDLSATATLFDRQYSYNTANQISQIVEPSLTRNFTYDNVDRLTGASNGGSGESYAYDPVGNRTSSHLSGTYTYQPFNRIASTQTASYGSDASGNMTTKSEGSDFWRFSWDFENRMTMASTRKTSVRYAYDALGRRVQRILGFGEENTKFIYDGSDVLADDNGGTLTKYLNGPGIDNKLRQTAGSNTSYFLADHLGSTNGLTDASGNLTASNSYDSFGNSTNAAFPTRYQYTGREFDSFTGLQHNRARFYDPKLGRFISEDPSGFGGGDVNLFGYVWNSPQNFYDPLGLDGWGNDAADWFDSNINYARDFYQADSQHWYYNSGIATAADLVRIAPDLLRVGSGVGYAIYDPDATPLQRGLAIVSDVGRAATIAAVVGAPASRLPGLVARFGAPADGIQACPIRPPNPYGKLGGPEHQAGVRAVEADIRARGLIPQTEFRVNTPGGAKPYRFADVAGLDSNGNAVEFHQVGRQTNKGLPVSRERQAIEDIRNATGINPSFHPYN